MKRLLVLLLIVTLLGCDNAAYKEHNRRVTLYDQTGKVLRIWEGSINYESPYGGTFRFRFNGEDVSIQGTFTVEDVK